MTVAYRPTLDKFIPFENLDDPLPLQSGRGVSGVVQTANGVGGAFGPGSPYIPWEFLDDPSPVQLGYGISGYIPPGQSPPIIGAGMNLKEVFVVVAVLALVGAAVAFTVNR